MNFSDVVKEVISITARPDKVALIESSINAVISLCTMKASFARDLVETSIPVPPGEFAGTFQFNNLQVPVVQRFRKFKYVKAYGVKGYLTPTSPEKVFTPGGNTQRDVYYLSGDSITYVLSVDVPSLEIGYYQYAPILDANKNNTYWMLEVMPWTIIDLTAARIFKGIGDDASAARYQASGDEAFKVNRRDHEDMAMAVVI